ncbi:glutaredoxin family protein [Deinococcus cellulosilyticus]|uniref:Uncharacterized protein n=1 Tax=Deinococcus cellulosilyticus (strain DSM 18568 / NBRC 106333 / KACC 11606 / 5516J-15) TaxID=1223518 RepID=A0A511N7R3_DEIC1|nr:glutaredoxin family protein [Deinococcus cellulosilyticus]GEM48874.1 hypothetical protein DC3_45090 [Deinococcus cellulosilyticus NBRC 106333 = KACC 11606]
MKVFYSRPGCSLCDKAEVLLQQAGIQYEKKDISNDVELEAAFGWEIPVLLEGDRVLLKGIFVLDDVMELRE